MGGIGDMFVWLSSKMLDDKKGILLREFRMIEDSNSLAIGREGVKESRYSQIEGERNIEEKMAKLMACLRFEKCCLWLEIEEKKKKG